jgi:hypothetical protein
MIAKMPVPDVIGDGNCFSGKIMRNPKSSSGILFDRRECRAKSAPRS